MARKVLIVYAHQSDASFNAAAKNAAVEVLTEQGYTVEVSDLYADRFKAVTTAEDIMGDVKNAEHFEYGAETKLAWEEGKLVADITEEQRKVTEADLIIFQFPMYWFSVPGIMKGWFDRVFTLGFAYHEHGYSNGVFKDKKAILSLSTGAFDYMFKADGVFGDINVTLWPLQNGILHLCGFQVLAPQIFWAPNSNSHEARTAMLDAWRTRLPGLLEEESLAFAPVDSSDGQRFRLKTQVYEQQAEEEVGPTVETHTGKPPSPNQRMGLKSGV